MEDFSKTAIELSGWSYTIFEHILALVYIWVFIIILTKLLSFKKNSSKNAVIISVISTLISFLFEIFVPIKLSIFSIILMIFVFGTLIKVLYNDNWKKTALCSTFLLVFNILSKCCYRDY